MYGINNYYTKMFFEKFTDFCKNIKSILIVSPIVSIVSIGIIIYNFSLYLEKHHLSYLLWETIKSINYIDIIAILLLPCILSVTIFVSIYMIVDILLSSGQIYNKKWMIPLYLKNASYIEGCILNFVLLIFLAISPFLLQLHRISNNISALFILFLMLSSPVVFSMNTLNIAIIDNKFLDKKTKKIETLGIFIRNYIFSIIMIIFYYFIIFNSIGYINFYFKNNSQKILLCFNVTVGVLIFIGIHEKMLKRKFFYKLMHKNRAPTEYLLPNYCYFYIDKYNSKLYALLTDDNIKSKKICLSENNHIDKVKLNSLRSLFLKYEDREIKPNAEISKLIEHENVNLKFFDKLSNFIRSNIRILLIISISYIMFYIFSSQNIIDFFGFGDYTINIIPYSKSCEYLTRNHVQCDTKNHKYKVIWTTDKLIAIRPETNENKKNQVVSILSLDKTFPRWN